MKFGSNVHKLAAAEVWYKVGELLFICKDTEFTNSLSQATLVGQEKYRAKVFFNRCRIAKKLIDKYHRWEKSHSYPGMPVFDGIFDLEQAYEWFYQQLPNFFASKSFFG